MNITPRNQIIIDFRLEHPELTLEAIGKEFDLTRERIRQILKEAEVETKSSTFIQREEERLIVPDCIRCGKPVSKKRLQFCSMECRYPLGSTTFACAFCGIEKTIRTTTYIERTSRYLKLHCSRTCRDNSRRK